MSNFAEALKINNLGNRIEEQYGRWGHFTEENAKTVVTVANSEALSWKLPAVSLMAMSAFTWLNESSWAFNPEPNTNGKPTSPWNWDVGPFQLNLQWTCRMIWQRDFSTAGLTWKGVWGQTFYAVDGVTPVAFNGDVIENAKCALRRMLCDRRSHGQLGFASREAMQIVLYTGPKAQSARLKNWNKYGEDFKLFFEAYTQ